jgi:CRP-like cAMP-binding protein
LLAVASSVAAMPYFLLQPTPLWAAFGWSVLFTGINILQAARLLVERRPVQLTSEEAEVHRRVFSELSPRKFLQLVGVGSWVPSEAGERLIEPGRSIEAISLIVQGTVHVSNAGRVLGTLGSADIVGSALLLSGVVPELEAVTSGPTRTIRWDTAILERYLDANPETRNVFQRHLARDLAGKLRQVTTHGSGTAPA